MTKLSKVFFLSVIDNASKLQKICAIIHSHFLKKEKVLIVAPSNEAATFIDQLLWRMPEDSFIPHAIANTSTSELVAITTTSSNVNKATVLVNLSTKIPPESGIDLIYELLDLTAPEKEAVSRKKQADYHSSGHLVEEIF